MVESDEQAAYRRDAATLAEIGKALLKQELPKVAVRLPAALAQSAVEAWEWDDEGDPDPTETDEQRLIRHRAASLALIGLAVNERGRPDGDGVVVELDPDLIGHAIDAADDLD